MELRKLTTANTEITKDKIILYMNPTFRLIEKVCASASFEGINDQLPLRTARLPPLTVGLPGSKDLLQRNLSHERERSSTLIQHMGSVREGKMTSVTFTFLNKRQLS